MYTKPGKTPVVVLLLLDGELEDVPTRTILRASPMGPCHCQFLDQPGKAHCSEAARAIVMLGS